jgi:two-component system NtrC family sensor kinase
LEEAAMRRRVLLLLAMIAAVVLASIPLYLDARREGAAALSDFAREQAALADAVASSNWSAAGLEKPDALIVLESSAEGALRRPSGSLVTSSVVTDAIARGARTVRLERPEAAALGLPTRTAVAGIAKAADGHATVVVATALRVRDREIHAQNRLLLGIALAALLVGIFGGIALRIQRKELVLERELAMKDAEKASEERLARADKLATMGAFATGIAHEIATPLAVIAARTEMLAHEERRARAAQTIVEQTDKIRGIIKSFLALARGESPEQSRIAPADLLSSAQRMVEHRFEAAEVALEISVPKDAPMVLGEPRLLEQALVNLLLNACDASKPGQLVHASVRTEGGRVCFCVEDDGVGISADVAAHATEPFFTTKPAGAGTGLGLAITNEIAKHHQGRFVIAARSEGGTAARLEVPA